jgi:type I restriction enzyme R subunit
MIPEVSERSFEEEIERALLEHGPDAHLGTTPASEVREAIVLLDESPPGGYLKRSPREYDHELCLIPRDVLDFILATQPKEWERLKEHYGAEVKEKLLKRLSRDIELRGVLDVLRNGIKDSGCKFQLAYFRPASGLNEEVQRLHAANLFSLVRQLRYSEKIDNSLDLVLFLNGIPILTAELKNPLSGQTVKDAIEQYRADRDPREPLLAYGRCLAHFAVDPDLVYVTTRLDGAKTLFLPFNQGKFGGAGNPPVPPTRKGYATSYLWERIWARDSMLDLIRQFIQEVEVEDERGRKTGDRFLIFPRFHQLDAVRSLVGDAFQLGPGRRYLIQHSAGSGKTNTIAWLAHRLSTLHNVLDERVFDSIIVISDRRILDRQLQRVMRQFEQILGVVENIDTTSRKLKEALESGKTIIVTTLQKFPVISREIGELPGKRFAVIVDEAHSSQSGETTKSLKSVLAVRSLEEAEREEAGTMTPGEAFDNLVLAETEKRGPSPNVSMFAFTATPKPKTLELFGGKREDGSFGPFHVYSMRQAIEEGFILDVLRNYTTYTAYWRLLKTTEDDPRYDKSKASYLLKSFVELHPHAINEKTRLMVEHFAAHVQGQIGGRAKAMIVTRSRLHAVRYKLAMDRYLKERGYSFKALVAFSGSVSDGEHIYTESGMNSLDAGRSISENQTAKEFEQPEYRFLIAADKFQTGFDQPLLHTMYVDKKLGGVNAVQTLSRLNRTCLGKNETLVLDFANEAEAIRQAFEPYYETTILSEATDPNLLYKLQRELLAFDVYTEPEVDGFMRICYAPGVTQSQLYSALAPVVERAGELADQERADFRSRLSDYVRLYSFLAQILTFADVDLEKLYVFARHLRRLIATEREDLPVEVQQNIDMESYRIQKTSNGRIRLERNGGRLEPIQERAPQGVNPEQVEPLSQIIAELNERFGIHLAEEDRVCLEQAMMRLNEDAALGAAARVNTRENVRLTFDNKLEDVVQQIVESNFKLYKRITDDVDFGKTLADYLFDVYLRKHREAGELIKQGESKTLEFKSSLRWNLREDRKHDRAITHAALKTIAAFLNTEGGDLLLGVADDGSLVGIEVDRFESNDKYMLHLAQVVRNGLGERAGTCIDPKIQVVQGRAVCLVSCQRSPEPVFLRWKDSEGDPTGGFYVRNGPGTIKLPPESAREYIRTRFPNITEAD